MGRETQPGESPIGRGQPRGLSLGVVSPIFYSGLDVILTLNQRTVADLDIFLIGVGDVRAGKSESLDVILIGFHINCKGLVLD